MSVNFLNISFLRKCSLLISLRRDQNGTLGRKRSYFVRFISGITPAKQILPSRIDLLKVNNRNTKYVRVIAWCRVQYGKYFPSFSYFATYLTSLSASEIIKNCKKRGKYLPILHQATCDNYFIVKCFLKSNASRIK